MAANINIKKVILIGGTGTIGSIILNGVLKSPFEISILSRASSKASFPASVPVLKADFDSEDELVRAFQGQDAVVSAVGGAGFSQQKAFINAAIKAGVKRFLPSEFSTNTRSEAARNLVSLFEAKQEILNHLKEKESSSFSWTALATGPLLDWGIKSGFLGFDLANKKAKLWDGGEIVYSATNEDDVAKAVVSILQHPVETANKYLYVETIAVSHRDILKSLKAATSQKWEVENVKTEDLVKMGKQLVAGGDFSGNFLLVQATVWGNGEGLRQNFVVDESLANSLLGLPKGDLEKTVRRVLNASENLDDDQRQHSAAISELYPNDKSDKLFEMPDENQAITSVESRPPRVAPGRSCIACRRRKIKCDRNQPCAYCVRIRVQCIYPVEEPKKQPDDNDVLSRLKRIESSLARLEATHSSNNKSLRVNQATTRSHDDTALLQEGARSHENVSHTYQEGTSDQELQHEKVQTTPGGSGKLVVEEGDTRFVNGSFWADLEEDATEHEEDVPSTSTGPGTGTETVPFSQPSNDNSYQRFIFGMTTVPQASGLRHLHPPEARIFSLWQVYLENVDPLLKILHVPTTQRQVLRASGHLDNIPPPVETLMFAIYFAAVTSLQCSEATQELLQQDRPTLLNQYRIGVEQSLANANFMTAPDVATLQALTLYLICARQTVDKAFVWSMVGLLYRLATKLGLHRDPASLGLPPFMTEMRRRLWWQICILDVRIAEDNDTDPLICEHNFDTKYPSNVNDGDLDLNMTGAPRTSHHRTELLFCLTRFDISYTARKLVFSPKFSSDNGYPSLSLSEKINMLDNLRKDLDENYFKYCDLEVPICFLAITASRLVLAKMRLIVHHPARNQSTELSQAQLGELVSTSIDIIEYAHELRTNVKYSRWVWLFQQYVEWDAVAFLLYSLTVSSLPTFTHRAWRAIDVFMEDWKDHIPNGQRERRWRRLLALHDKARVKQGHSTELDDQRPSHIPAFSGTNDFDTTNSVHQTNTSLSMSQPVPSDFQKQVVSRHNQQTAAVNGNQNLPIMTGATLDGYFSDWGLDNVSYSMPEAASWDMRIDEDWNSSWF
ncbi:hypothetical protein LTR84_001722 [Exophiala bonariae]|uniref:Zn(2)-C6 fungal-type domain-containing protein n=1 Tax=Exophiala bonariae TaxID=1690606 RepID=A0AAV9NB92_9EURO|nr:hypothetical protein LTR84_001722 [Exophiala bonariae]